MNRFPSARAGTEPRDAAEPEPLDLFAIPPTVTTTEEDSPHGATTIRVRFRWSGDRFKHVIDAGGRVVAESVEGDSDSLWPPSPPIQQLSLETLDGRPTLLGVGAAGRSHWSVSVQAVPHDRAAVFEFDWACRFKSDPGVLGSEYRLHDSLRVTPLAESEIHADRQGRTRIVPETPAAETSRPAAETPTRPAGTTPTRRWRYRIELPNEPERLVDSP